MRKTIIAALLSASVAVPVTLAVAGPMHHHRKNLLEAEKDLTRAWEHINASQRANEFDEGGHAQKAKGLIEAAKREIHEAAEWDNHRR